MSFHPSVVVLFTLLAVTSPIFGQVGELTQPEAAQQSLTITEIPKTPIAVNERADKTTLRSLTLAEFLETEASANGSGSDPFWSSCCECDDQPFETLFLFGGQFTKGAMGKTADLFNVTYDDNWIIGLGYQRFPWARRRVYLGCEIGVAARFGDRTSAEIWAGPAIRHRGINCFDRLTITPSLTAGFSAVTESQGFERHREIGREGDAAFLFYLGPEFAFSSCKCPNTEVFYRLHHRCGANGTLGDLSEGYNANVIGVRFKF